MNGHDKPLALYLFTRSRATGRKVLGACSFGGGCINDYDYPSGDEPDAVRRRGGKRDGRLPWKGASFDLFPTDAVLKEVQLD